MAFVRLLLLMMIALCVVYLSLYFFLLAVHRDREKRNYPESASERERSAFVAARVRSYAARMRRWLALIVFGVPLIGLAVIVYVTNFM